MSFFQVSIFVLMVFFKNLSGSDLDYLISPEIKNDDFYMTIYELCSTEPIHTILEIGSSSGEGSTEAFAKGIEINPCKPTLFCIEMVNIRFNALKEHYKNHPQVRCYHCSSVPLSQFPSEKEVLEFFAIKSPHKPYNLNISWLRQDIEYLQTHDIIQNGIEMIKQENGISQFDMVLIDGSEFTGKAEMKLVYGAKYILLDDVCVYKNRENYERLIQDPRYNLLTENHNLRNGYAIFVKN